MSAYVGSSKNLQDLKKMQKPMVPTPAESAHYSAVAREKMQGYLAHEKTRPPRTTIGTYVSAYCRILEGGVFL